MKTFMSWFVCFMNIICFFFVAWTIIAVVEYCHKEGYSQSIASTEKELLK